MFDSLMKDPPTQAVGGVTGVKATESQQTRRQPPQGIVTQWLASPFAKSPSIEAITVHAENKAPVQCVNSSPAEGLVWVVSTPGQPKVKYLTLLQSVSMKR